VQDGRRRDNGWQKVRDEACKQLMLPEEVERDHGGNDVRPELRGMHLVMEDFLFQRHARPELKGL